MSNRFLFFVFTDSSEEVDPLFAALNYKEDLAKLFENASFSCKEYYFSTNFSVYYEIYRDFLSST